MKQYFQEINGIIKSSLKEQEDYTANFSGEELNFARFNKAKIRQSGVVNQAYVKLQLIKGQKQSSFNIGLTHDKKEDSKLITAALQKLRDQVTALPPDPYLLINKEPKDSQDICTKRQIAHKEIIGDVLKQAASLDFVGCYYGGPIYKGFTSSYGQENWFENSSFVIEYSAYHSGDKAVKQCYADTSYDSLVMQKKLQEAKRSLSILAKPSVSVKKGNYRVYFSPAAVYEMLSMLNWGGFSEKAMRVKNSPLCPLRYGKDTFHPQFSLSEHTALGIGPNFQEQGFIKPPCTHLISNGKFTSGLISPKTALEYDIAPNGADPSETASTLEMDGGDIPFENISSVLCDGLYVNNLWYLNFSDRQNARITGMTRFFCYVVENGQAKDAFTVMRFDDSLYRIFGKNLLGLTKERELLIDSGTYGQRSTECAILPGIIAEDVRFTL